MISITSVPYGVSLQGMPIVFKVTSNMVEEPYFKVLAAPVSGQSDLLALNDDDVAVFDLREYFKPELSVLFATTPTLHANAAKQFNVVFYEYYGNPPTIHASVNHNIIVMIGKIPKWKQAAFRAEYPTNFNLGFDNWLSSNIFLSWYPAQPKKVLPTQPEVLYFIAPNSASYAPTVVVKFTDGTTATHSPAISITAQASQIASLPVGYAALGLASVNILKTVASYVVTIGGKTRSYVLDLMPYRDVRYIIFRNSLGGYDVLPCTGEADTKTEVQRSVAQRVYDPEATERTSKMVYNIDEKENITVNTGWLQANEKRWLNDLFISEDVYDLVGSVMSPIMITGSDLNTTERIYEPGSVEIEYERLTFAV